MKLVELLNGASYPIKLAAHNAHVSYFLTSEN